MLRVGNVYVSGLNAKFRLSVHVLIDSVSVLDAFHPVPGGEARLCINRHPWKILFEFFMSESLSV